MLILRDRGHDQDDSDEEPEHWYREIAILLFAAFLVNTTTNWLLIPVPFIVALLLVRFWLLRPLQQVQRLRAARQAIEPHRAIDRVVEYARARSDFESIRKARTAKLQKAELSADDYTTKLESYRAHFGDRLRSDTLAEGITPREAVFATTDRDPWANARFALETGAWLAVVPIVIALYQYLPRVGVDHPYPHIELVVFFLSGIANWLLYAFFLGYFYDHVRGNSGLAKGLCISVALIVPLLVYRLLLASPLDDMRPFFFWAAQVFAFCTIVGLAMDWSRLKRYGFGVGSLRAVHDMPALSLYGTSIAAALVPTILAVVTGRLGEIVSFFVNIVLPRVPTTP